MNRFIDDGVGLIVHPPSESIVPGMIASAAGPVEEYDGDIDTLELDDDVRAAALARIDSYSQALVEPQFALVAHGMHDQKSHGNRFGRPGNIGYGESWRLGNDDFGRPAIERQVYAHTEWDNEFGEPDTESPVELRWAADGRGEGDGILDFAPPPSADVAANLSDAEVAAVRAELDATDRSVLHGVDMDVPSGFAADLPASQRVDLSLTDTLILNELNAHLTSPLPSGLADKYRPHLAAADMETIRNEAITDFAITPESALIYTVGSHWNASALSKLGVAVGLGIDPDAYGYMQSATKSIGNQRAGNPPVDYARAKEIRAALPSSLSAVTTAVNRHTQDVLSDMYPNGEAPVYRGVTRPAVDGAVSINPISSWSLESQWAANFGERTVKSTIPLSSVFSFGAATGWGAPSEAEVILSTPSRTVTVDDVRTESRWEQFAVVDRVNIDEDEADWIKGANPSSALVAHGMHDLTPAVPEPAQFGLVAHGSHDQSSHGNWARFSDVERDFDGYYGKLNISEYPYAENDVLQVRFEDHGGEYRVGTQYDVTFESDADGNVTGAKARQVTRDLPTDDWAREDITTWLDDQGIPVEFEERSSNNNTLAEAAEALDAGRDETYDTTYDVYTTNVVADNGRTYEVYSDPTVDQADYASVQGYITDVNTGERVGGFERTIDYETGTVSNDSFEITNPSLRGQGIGSAFLDATESQLADAGIERALITSVSAGRYAWAARGYQTTNPYRDVGKLWVDKAQELVDAGGFSDIQAGRVSAVRNAWESGAPVFGSDLLAIDDRFKSVFLEPDSPTWNGTRYLKPEERHRPWYDPNQLQLDFGLVQRFKTVRRATDGDWVRARPFGWNDGTPTDGFILGNVSRAPVAGLLTIVDSSLTRTKRWSVAGTTVDPATVIVTDPPTI